MPNLIDTIRSLPRPLRDVVYRCARPFVKKYTAEMAFWKTRWKEEKGRFSNDSYRKMMLAMAGETDDSFLAGKVVADFGCGPRGSLAWADRAALRIGIDVLAGRYFDAFGSALAGHGMTYLTCTETSIPLASESVDVMFTLNAMDHVDDFARMSAEVLRVMRPGALFVGSFNLNEPPAPCEPQSLSEDMVKSNLLSKLDVVSCQVSAPGKDSERYHPLIEGNPLPYEPGQETVLWVRSKKG